MAKIRERINALKEAIDLNEQRLADAKACTVEANKRYEVADISISSSRRRLTMLEADLARVNKQVEEQTEKLDAFTSKTAADDEVRVKLESREFEDDGRLVECEDQAKAQKMIVEDLEQQCVEGSRKISALEVEIDKVDTRYNESVARVNDLTDRLNQAEAECADLKRSECTQSEKDIENEEKSRFLEEQRKESGLRADNAERDVRRLSRIVDETRSEIALWKSKTEEVRVEIQELGDLE